MFRAKIGLKKSSIDSRQNSESKKNNHHIYTMLNIRLWKLKTMLTAYIKPKKLRSKNHISHEYEYVDCMEMPDKIY